MSSVAIKKKTISRRKNGKCSGLEVAEVWQFKPQEKDKEAKVNKKYSKCWEYKANELMWWVLWQTLWGCAAQYIRYYQAVWNAAGPIRDVMLM